MKPGTDNEPGRDFAGREPISSIVDCVVIGGGPAGLSAAVNVGRMRRSVVIVDDRDGRSLWGQTNRNYLGFPDGIPAADIRLAGRKQAARYGARFIHAHVSAAGWREGEGGGTGRVGESETSREEAVGRERNASDRASGATGATATADRVMGAANGYFQLDLDPCPDPREGEIAGRPGNAARDLDVGRSLGERRIGEPARVCARTVIIATGVRDSFPTFPGWVECVGRSLFWCINCDGYETMGHRVAVVGADEEAAETALQLLDFTPRRDPRGGHRATASGSPNRVCGTWPPTASAPTPIQWPTTGVRAVRSTASCSPTPRPRGWTWTWSSSTTDRWPARRLRPCSGFSSTT